MKLSKSLKIGIGVLTLLQLVGVIGFIYKAFGSIMAIASNPEVAESDAVASMMSVMGGATLISILGMILLVFYIVHAASNKSIQGGEKAMWIVLFFFLSIISMPLYFFLRIWKEKESINPEGDFREMV